MRKIKNGLILAGGDSTRFWPLEEKNLFSFLGTPLILYQIEEISKFVEKVTVIASQTNIVAIKRLVENSELAEKVEIFVQKNQSGQAGAVLSVKNLVKGETLVLNANDVIDYHLAEKLINLPQQNNRIVLFGKKVNEYFPGGYFKFDAKEKIEEIVEKPTKDKVPSNIVKLVFDYFSDLDDLIKTIENVSSSKDDHYEMAINKILKSGINREYFIYEGFWQSLKFSWHILPMMTFFLSKIKKIQISPNAFISEKSLIVGPVVIEDGVKIGDYVKIVGPAYIGENTVIGDYTLIRESQIGADCLVGSYSEVARSYIGNKVYLHRNYVGDSVLADEVMMGAQAVTANFRFDSSEIKDTNLSKLGAIIGRQSKIGVNSTLTPGIKIGKNTWIGPGETVKMDIEDKKYIYKGEEKENYKI